MTDDTDKAVNSPLQQPHPYISDARTQRFLASVKNVNLRAAGIFTIQCKWKKKRYSITLGPDDVASYTDRIIGRLRTQSALYLVARDGNRCTIKSSYCIMGDNPFSDPIHADFDHIDGDNLHQQLKNLRLACHPCNSHQQKLQWKRNAAPASTQGRESEKETHTQTLSLSFPEPTSGELARSIEMYPATVEYLFHPIRGKLTETGNEIEKDWVVNNLPEIIGIGRATTYGKYVHEFVKQEYLKEQTRKGVTYLVRTGKKTDELLERVLGITVNKGDESR